MDAALCENQMIGEPLIVGLFAGKTLAPPPGSVRTTRNMSASKNTTKHTPGPNGPQLALPSRGPFAPRACSRQNRP